MVGNRHLLGHPVSPTSDLKEVMTWQKGKHESESTWAECPPRRTLLMLPGQWHHRHPCVHTAVDAAPARPPDAITTLGLLNTHLENYSHVNWDCSPNRAPYQLCDLPQRH